MRSIVSIRFDWSPHTSRFTVRMPTSTHDIFTELVVQEIGSQLKSVAHGDTDIAAVLDLVRSESTSDVYLYGHEAIDECYPKHSPDASFAHAKSQYPSVVIETSYSQRQKGLTRLADEYISGSDGNIAMVLGLDIEYGVGSKKASIFFITSCAGSPYQHTLYLSPLLVRLLSTILTISHSSSSSAKAPWS